MNPSQHVTTLRHTHRAATTLLPVLTATLTVAGAVIAAMESRAPHASAEAAELTGAAPGQAAAEGDAGAFVRAQSRAGRVTLRAYLATLAGRILLVALGIALIFSLVYVASATGRVGQAVLLTALILLALYLTEKVAAARRA